MDASDVDGKMLSGASSGLLLMSESGQLGPLHSPRASLHSPALPSAAAIPAAPLGEHNPFDATFGQIVVGPSSSSGGRIMGRTLSMQLLTAAAELEVKRADSPMMPAIGSAYSNDPSYAVSPTVSYPVAPATMPVSGLSGAPDSEVDHANRPAAKRRKASDAHGNGQRVLQAVPKRPSVIVKEDEEEEKRERFLERNRVAAQKCRRKKKERMEDLRTTTAEYERQNSNLVQQVEFYKEQNYFVRTLLFEHKDCPVMQQAGLAQLFDSATRPSVPVATGATSLLQQQQQRPFPPLPSQMLRAALAGPSLYSS